MNNTAHRIYIKNETLKFSSAHMTVFPDGSKEHLHGHNFVPEVCLFMKMTSLQEMMPFGDFKTVMKEICESWNEKVLLPEKCPLLKIKSRSATEIDFTLCDKHYVLPMSDVVLLPFDNTTTENLAEEFCRLFVQGIGKLIEGGKILGVKVRVDEMNGQGSSYMKTLAE